MLPDREVLSDRYRLECRLATGAMGEVWRALDLALGRPVAIKVMRPELQQRGAFEARFQAEAQTMAALSHPGIVPVYDYGSAHLPGGAPIVYLVMGYVDGQPLSRRVAEMGRLSPAETMSIVAQAAQALDVAHRHGVVHRDVKPSNLLIGANGTVTVVDFGIARTSGTTDLTTSGMVMGTAAYMAPEQASGAGAGPASDVYSLGAVAYHCLAGRPPFSGDSAITVALRQLTETPPPLPPYLPAAVSALVFRALSKDPAERFASAGEFAHAARSLVHEQGTQRGLARVLASRSLDDGAEDAGTLATFDLATESMPPPRRRYLAVLTGAVVALLLAMGVFAVMQAHSGPAATSPPPSHPATPSGGTSVAPQTRTATPTRTPTTAQTRAPGAPTTTAPGRSATRSPAPVRTSILPSPPSPPPTTLPSVSVTTVPTGPQH